jgi:hypothetical protein
MERTLPVSNRHAQVHSHATVSSGDAASRQPVLTTAVGASYAFDPGVDGLASIYAARVLERGIDPRALCAEIRADRLGLVDRGPQRRAMLGRTRTTRFGRGTATHLRLRAFANEPAQTTLPTSDKRPDRAARPRWGLQLSVPRKLAAAGVAALLFLPLGVIVAHAQDTAPQSRYVEQPGDTPNSIAAEFEHDPAAMLRAIAIDNRPSLSPEEIFASPNSSESSDAAWNPS